MKKIFLIFMATVTAVMIFCLTGCTGKLEKEGYKYDGINDWYVKDGEEKDDGQVVEGTIINLTQSDSNLSKEYVVDSATNRVVFVGSSSVTYTNFNIKVTSRASEVYIELQNFKFEAPQGCDAINAEDVYPTYCVYIFASGNSSVKGGSGINGDAGTSYDSSSSAAKDGGKGETGGEGYSAICGNSVYVKAEKASKLILTGGTGGIGGSGGNGEKSSGGSWFNPGKGGGVGGDGGTGGAGGAALKINDELKIENNGSITITGGVGGLGGNGGNGGEGANSAMYSTDHGGNGGNGGNGGVGGYGIMLAKDADLKVAANNAVVNGGLGGCGGNGGDGGSAYKHTLDLVSSGANPGAAGNGGNGG